MQEIVSEVKSLTGNTGAMVKSAIAKTSLTRMTKDLIFQFPMLITEDVEKDEIFPINKSIEKNEASLVQSAVMMDSLVDRTNGQSMLSHIRKFHNNDQSELGYFKGLVGGVFESSMTVDDLKLTTLYDSNFVMTESDRKSMWANYSAQFDTEKLNDVYLPFNRTEAKLNRALESNAEYLAATEAVEKKYLYERTSKGEINTFNGNPIIKTDKWGKPMVFHVDKPDASGASSKPSSEEKIKMVGGGGKSGPDLDGADQGYLLSNSRNVRTGSEIVREDRYNALNPTMIKLTLTNIKDNVGAWSQEVVIGVRSMPRIIPSSVMVANMLSAFKDRPIFTYIKWTKGEVKTADLLLGVSRSKDLAKLDNSQKFIKMGRRKAISSKFTKLIGDRAMPNTTIIISEAEAYEIKRQSGVDPHDPGVVKKMINKYFLLGFGIYDTEAKMLDMFYDGMNDFSTHSLRSLIADTKREMDLNTRR